LSRVRVAAKVLGLLVESSNNRVVAAGSDFAKGIE
jgi:hypothetical protein